MRIDGLAGLKARVGLEGVTTGWLREVPNLGRDGDANGDRADGPALAFAAAAAAAALFGDADPPKPKPNGEGRTAEPNGSAEDGCWVSG